MEEKVEEEMKVGGAKPGVCPSQIPKVTQIGVQWGWVN